MFLEIVLLVLFVILLILDALILRAIDQAGKDYYQLSQKVQSLELSYHRELFTNLHKTKMRVTEVEEILRKHQAIFAENKSLEGTVHGLRESIETLSKRVGNNFSLLNDDLGQLETKVSMYEKKVKLSGAKKTKKT